MIQPVCHSFNPGEGIVCVNEGLRTGDIYIQGHKDKWKFMDYGYPSDPGGLVLLLTLMLNITGMTLLCGDIIYPGNTQSIP